MIVYQTYATWQTFINVNRRYADRSYCCCIVLTITTLRRTAISAVDMIPFNNLPHVIYRFSCDKNTGISFNTDAV